MSPRMTRSTAAILLVEDDVDIRMAITEVLRLAGYRVQGVSDADGALGQLQAGLKPQLILLDLNLPPHGSTPLVSAPARIHALCDAPIIVMSADGDADVKKTLTGVVAVIEKPFEIDVLLRLIEQHCR